MTRRVIIIGGGIAGLTVAERLTATLDSAEVTVELREGSDRVGGALKTSPFAGRPAVDEGADAFLARVTHGTALARRVGLGDQLTSPAASSAFVWHHGLHHLPDGLLLGVPANVRGLATSRLLSARGKLRAAIEPLLPPADDGDSIGKLIRGRFGDEVHERLVDALVGSIYATDTDRFSLSMVPQLAALSDGRRSLLLAARQVRRSAPTAAGPVFRTPSAGMQGLAEAAASTAERGGALISRGVASTSLARDGDSWLVDDVPTDAVIIAAPASVGAELMAPLVPELSATLSAAERASVAIITLAVPDWPTRLRGHSGYLVPKPVQHLVTATSFGSQKWKHWRGADEIVRISVGRDGLPIDDIGDDDLVDNAVTELGHHLDLDVQPNAVRITRWPRSFPQYRPGHRKWLAAIDAATPPGVFLTGASYRGIGIPACIADAERTAAAVVNYLGR